jgi:ArsR family transcriptional regulator, virulence genes transcriptional regulator
MNLSDLTQQADRAEAFLKLLANAHRLMLLCELLKGERSVTALHQAVGLSQSAASQHLAKMREGGIVRTRRDGLTIYYALERDDVRRIIELLHQFYCSVDKPDAPRKEKAS